MLSHFHCELFLHVSPTKLFSSFMCHWTLENGKLIDRIHIVNFVRTGAFPRSRRRNSETCRAQYINAKEIKYVASPLYWLYKLIQSSFVIGIRIFRIWHWPLNLCLCYYRVRADTWNVGGRLPPDDLDIEDWLDIDNPADIYAIG